MKLQWLKKNYDQMAGWSAVILLALGLVGYAAYTTLQPKVYRASISEPTLTKKPAPKVLSTSDISIPEMYNLANDKRANVGIPALKLNGSLSAAAQERCSGIVAKDQYSHTIDGNDKAWTQPIKNRVKYSLAYENLNSGVDSAKAAIDTWMTSKNHREAMLSPDMTDVGYAVCKSENLQNRGQSLVVVQFLIKEYVEPAPKPVVNYYQQPTYQPPRATYCTTNYYDYTDTAYTTCR